MCSLHLTLLKPGTVHVAVDSLTRLICVRQHFSVVYVHTYTVCWGVQPISSDIAVHCIVLLLGEQCLLWVEFGCGDILKFYFNLL